MTQAQEIKEEVLTKLSLRSGTQKRYNGSLVVVSIPYIMFGQSRLMSHVIVGCYRGRNAKVCF